MQKNVTTIMSGEKRVLPTKLDKMELAKKYRCTHSSIIKWLSFIFVQTCY